MKRIVKAPLALAMLTLIGGQLAFAAEPSSSSQDHASRNGVLWRSNVLPCTLALCGGFAQNVATLDLKHGQVFVLRNGLVSIHLDGVTILSTGEIAANKTLTVSVGNFTQDVFGGSPGLPAPAGTITTDNNGNFNGTIDAGGGVAFSFAESASVSGQFAFDEPGVRTEFVTGFVAR